MACETEQASAPEPTQTGLRSDGYYESHDGNIIYLARFFNDGNVVMVGGLKEGYVEMLSYLTPNGPEKNDNVHYVPFEIHENDSIFYHTRTPRGHIEYQAFSESADTLRVLKWSHINGNRKLLNYGFNPYVK